ncbi:MAG: tetratricopeptide repeat protein [Bacteroidetes bacterium]|nr:tetratricopeptide repeat protein [Bacteroidota bacterium]
MKDLKNKVGFIFNKTIFSYIFCLTFSGIACSYSQNAFENILDTISIDRIKRLDETSQLKELRYAFDIYASDSTKMKSLSERMGEENFLIGNIYALTNLARVHDENTQHVQEIYFLKEAEKLLIETDELYLLARVYSKIGQAYKKIDLVGPSLLYFNKVIDIRYDNPIQDNLHKLIASAHKNLGEILTSLQQYELSITEFEKAIEINNKRKNHFILAINYQQLGNAKEQLGDLEEALIYYNKAAFIYENVFESELGKAIIYNCMGRLYIAKGMNNEANIILEDALKRAKKINDNLHIADIYVNLGKAQFFKGQVSLAKNNIIRGIEISEEELKTNPDLTEVKIKGLSFLSDIYKNDNDYKSALMLYKAADSLANSVSDTRNISYLDGLLLKYENETKLNLVKELESKEVLSASTQTNVALTVLLSVIAVLLITVLLFIFHRQQQSNQEKKILALEQNMLKSQMNPHFIFNSLNSIKQYIIGNEIENAVYYLNKFAKLIRKILDTSNKKDISLAEELETMTTYMTIENMRFSNEIDFKINVADDIDSKKIRVPSLILQPFIENSLWHGLSSKLSDKKIIIDVKNTIPDYVSISITDNGVGRKISKERKLKETFKRRSVGIEITKERLFSFAKRFNRSFELKIEDLYDEQNVASGTKIILNIPV